MSLAGKQIGRAASVVGRRLVGRPALFSGRTPRSARFTTVCKVHKICVLPGDGIGPEIMEVATKALSFAGAKEGDDFEYKYCLIGGAAIDATGKPLPEETLATAKESDAVLLAAIGGYACNIASSYSSTINKHEDNSVAKHVNAVRSNCIPS